MQTTRSLTGVKLVLVVQIPFLPCFLQTTRKTRQTPAAGTWFAPRFVQTPQRTYRILSTAIELDIAAKFLMRTLPVILVLDDEQYTLHSGRQSVSQSVRPSIYRPPTDVSGAFNARSLARLKCLQSSLWMRVSESVG